MMVSEGGTHELVRFTNIGSMSQSLKAEKGMSD